MRVLFEVTVTADPNLTVTIDASGTIRCQCGRWFNTPAEHREHARGKPGHQKVRRLA